MMEKAFFRDELPTIPSEPLEASRNTRHGSYG